MLRKKRRIVSADTAQAALEVAAFSTKGPRDENQDYLSWTQNSRGELFVIADGMGGHVGGARAARMTVDAVEAFLAQAPREWPLERALAEAIRTANEDVHRVARSGDPETHNMGSTVLVALVSDGKAHIGHVGDSRAYLYRHGRLRRLTRDHTRLQQMVDARMLTRRQARNHPDSSVLSRAIGRRPDVEVEIARPFKLKKGDALLLCSDGLSGFVKDEPIRKVLARQPDVQRVPGDLVNLALSAGGSDNITIQFVRVGSRSRGLAVTRLPVLVGAAVGSSAIALGLAALLTTPPVATRPDIFIAPDTVSEDRREFTRTATTTPAAPSRLEAPAVRNAAGPPPAQPAASETPTPAAPSPEPAAGPISIVPPPLGQTPEAAPAGGPGETVPENEPTQTPVAAPTQTPIGEPAPSPTEVPAPAPTGEPVVPERNSDDPPPADGAAPGGVVSAATRQNGGFCV